MNTLTDKIYDLYMSASNLGLPNGLIAVSQEKLRALYRDSAKLNEEPGSVQVPVDLNVFDKTGVVVDGTTANLTLAQVSDIVDHAAQVVLIARDNRDTGFEPDLGDLEEALVVANVIDEE